MSNLLYILSHGHSGSTLLDLVCGSIDGAFSCGELRYLPWQFKRNGQKDGGVERQDICTCLEPFRNCIVWRPVWQHLSDRVGCDLFKNPFEYPISISRPQHYFQHKSFLPQSTARSLYMRLCKKHLLQKTSGFFYAASKKSVQRNWALFDAIEQVSGKKVIVDSTKDLLRFHMLYLKRRGLTRLIVLERDVKKVASSYAKMGSDPVQAARSWQRYYTQVDCFMRQYPDVPVLYISYEEMCRNPEETRRHIAEFSGLPLPQDEMAIDTTTYHLVAGNPSRYAGQVTIRSDESWRTSITNASQVREIQQIGDETQDVMNRIRIGGKSDV